MTSHVEILNFIYQVFILSFFYSFQRVLELQRIQNQNHNDTVQPHYNVPHYNVVFNITLSFHGSQIDYFAVNLL